MEIENILATGGGTKPSLQLKITAVVPADLTVNIKFKS